jgi:phosphoribosylanthranilate isomerase
VAPGTTDAASLREAAVSACDQADVVLLDTSTGARFGGTGSAFPWALAAEVGSGCPLLIAGGITPENVGAALRESGAWGVDVSSGVERSPGVKDAERLRRLLVNAGAAAGALHEASRPGRGRASAGMADRRQEGPHT